MIGIRSGALEAIGNTPLVELKKIVPVGCGRVIVKLEGTNPTGSMKDRMAHAVIARPEEDGRLSRGWTVVDYSGGSTGAALALVCAAKGYPLRIFSSDAFAEEKLVQMVALGAEVTVLPSGDGLATRSVFNRMIDAARQASSEPRSYWINQLENRDSIARWARRFGIRAVARSMLSSTRLERWPR